MKYQDIPWPDVHYNNFNDQKQSFDAVKLNVNIKTMLSADRASNISAPLNVNTA